ncbi:formimidoylglutamase [Nocardia sp. NPDC005978]|uniref:formimidoylglutamase n=1 Tax=Nocardia sp. NPDC005978 TaxID=3156725 RepID=UPI0033B7FE4C
MTATDGSGGAEIVVDVPPAPWTGRIDGDGPEHLRWHGAVRPYDASASETGCVLIGFASDEGVRRNLGRVGAAAGPDALRAALASMALAAPLPIEDAGTVAVTDGDLEAGQRRLARAVTAAIDSARLPVVLGGGHEVAYGTYLGVAASRPRRTRPRLGILNLDAHFDLRADPVPSSGTPFRQALEAERAAGTPLRYAVLGISEPSNTPALFAAAATHDVHHLLDENCTPANLTKIDTFLDAFVSAVDLIHLTIDLDVLPASVTPGVSAPAAYGVPLETIHHVCARITTTGKLIALDVAELNPTLDIDNRTARTAARLIHTVVTRHVAPTT